MASSALTVARVFGDVLARMAFLAGDLVGKEDLPAARSAVVVSMGFRGPRSGTLALALPAALCTQVAANLLGLEEDDPRAKAGGVEAAQELLNVTCGHLLVALAGDGIVFDLSPPRADPMDDAAWRALLAAPDSVGVLVEDEHPVLLRVATEGGPCPSAS